MSRALIRGYSYVSQESLLYTREQWRQYVAEKLAAGCRRRVEHGETYLHNAQGRIVAEIYANIAAPKCVIVSPASRSSLLRPT